MYVTAPSSATTAPPSSAQLEQLELFHRNDTGYCGRTPWVCRIPIGGGPCEICGLHL
jgi:hypothetical protein